MAENSPYCVNVEALSALGHGVCVIDEQDRIVDWNHRLEKFGVPGADAIGYSLMELLDARVQETDRAEDVRAAVADCRQRGESVTVRHVEVSFPTNPEGVFHFCLTPERHDSGSVIVVLEDVTEARRVRAYYERILDSSPDGIFVIDRNRQIRLFNEACGHITGRAFEEVLHDGCECSNVIHCHTEEGESYATHLCPARNVFRGDDSHETEEMLLTNANGEERWVETTYSAIPNDRGEVEYVVGILRDVHERKHLEEKLNQTEKLASLGQLVAGIAHEIKNPLAIIGSSLDVIESTDRPDGQKREAASFVRSEVQHIDELLRSFLAFARPRELQLAPMLLSGLLRRRAAALELVFPNINIDVQTASPEPIVLADEEQLGQVVTNLGMNAGEAMNGEGTIVLRTCQRHNSAVLEVEDSGPGVPEEHTARIFDPFFTTKESGTGLGLSICYQIVLAHGGTISISNRQEGTGTVFSIRLPISARRENGSAAQHHGQTNGRSG